MRLLLDTHVLLWALNADPRIDKVRRWIESEASEVYVSAASYWELAIKIGIGKFAHDLAEIRQAAQDSGFLELAVTGEHALTLLKLPNHHKDPFDRLIVAQAITEPMRLLTADEQVARYTDLAVHILSPET